MEFLVFRRTDSALVVVPAMFDPPAGWREHGPLRFDAVCDIELDAFTPEVVAQLRQEGFALVKGPDWDLVPMASARAETESG